MNEAETQLLAPLLDLAPFAGSWIGSGEGHYPTIDDFSYDEQIDFVAGGKPFLTYLSRTWKPGQGMAMHTENGFLRTLSDGKIELLISQPTGFVEIHRGEVRDGALELTLSVLEASPDAKAVHEIRRRFVVSGDVLRYDLWMAHDRTPMTHHLSAELTRRPRGTGNL